MIGTDRLSETLVELFSRPNGGIVGLVDELLPICLENNVELDLEADRSRVRSVGGNWEELKRVALPRPVFRTVLARIAAICNERGQTVSPYGGEGELSISDDPKPMLRVAFCNTSSVQKLTLSPLTSPSADEANGSGPGHGNESRPVLSPDE
jgi:hypothetical protein